MKGKRQPRSKSIPRLIRGPESKRRAKGKERGNEAQGEVAKKGGQRVGGLIELSLPDKAWEKTPFT